ncbi:hypothetical protein CEP88_18760 [Roseobacter denitrificans]|uniref:Uncharacterized protein n=2 Tax=Roseobacter denitrificans TaxID=2434 RepID=Q169C9_ROSDO|nr:hypothetical protein RD1_1796 [Roseobacter denitrificans OCh 114]AVL55061.1 hypothetical protein CEP88_18760 [Roseobacter denitrificans]SFG00936.1 hypothetical protein SAMN05443635_105234 [Roseobacter denitrificans OCh 114]
MPRALITALCCVALALPAAAQPYRAVNWLYVVPISQDSFEVLDDRWSSAKDFWCAAADYARASGLDGVRKRLYIVDPLGASKTTDGVKGVVFTVTPDDAMKNTPSSYSVSVKRRNENLAIGHAYNFCDNLLEEVFGGF